MIPTLAPPPSLAAHPLATTSQNSFFKYNFSASPLKSDHESRPIWVCSNLHLYLETYSPIYKQAYDFLIAISDPVSRPLFIHEYVISQYSLYAAASLGLSTDDIIFGLQRLCKNQVPQEVKSFIAKHTEKCGKVKLLLKNQRYYIESPYHTVLTELLFGSQDIKNARCDFNTRTSEGVAEKREFEARQEQLQRQALLENPNAAFTRRAALNDKHPVHYEYDERSGLIVEEIGEDEHEIFLQGTGTVDKDGKRTLTRIDQRVAMGLGALPVGNDLDQLGGGDFYPGMDFNQFSGQLGKNSLGGGFDHNDDLLFLESLQSTKSKKKSRKGIKVEEWEDNSSDSSDDGSDESDLDDIDADDDDFISSDSDSDDGAATTRKGKKKGKGAKKAKKAPTKPLSKKAQAAADDAKAQKLAAKQDRARRRREASQQLLGKGGILTHTKLYSFEIVPEAVEAVRSASNVLGYPMLEEYDFRHDHTIDHCILPMSLRPQAQIREYQEKALSKMFGNGRARSGIIVLPCGAGKTLVGITAMATINRSTLIVASTSVAAQQWKAQVKLWTTMPEEQIYVFTSDSKTEIKHDAKVVIATYSMLAYEQQRSGDAQKVMDVITQSEWGLLLLDEVHVAPADKFKKCITTTHSRCKLGLTATLVREDDRVVSLIEMIGPKLYEASWLDLSRQGFIATVRCYEVWCPMTAGFYKQFINAPHHLQRQLYVLNPNKLQTLEALMLLHESRGDKIMIFCEDTDAIRLISASLDRPAVMGETKDSERLRILKNFSTSPRGDSIIISKVGDNSIDLPDTNVIIQISSHYASRRQEAQRLGRILRPKSHRSGTIDAHFYSLVSQDTSEMHYATKRQRFLVDQGYAYKILKQENVLELTKALYMSRSRSNGRVGLGFSTPEKQQELLDFIIEKFNVDRSHTQQIRSAALANVVGRNTTGSTAKVRKGRGDDDWSDDDVSARAKGGIKRQKR